MTRESAFPSFARVGEVVDWGGGLSKWDVAFLVAMHAGLTRADYLTWPLMDRGLYSNCADAADAAVARFDAQRCGEEDLDAEDRAGEEEASSEPAEDAVEGQR